MPLSKIDQFVAIPFNSTKNFVNDFKGLVNAQKENKQLKKQIAEQSLSIEQYNSLKRKNNSLKDLLNLKVDNSFRKVSQILVRSPNNWSDAIIIDGGKKSGFKKFMIVVDGKSMIGKITNVSEVSSHVDLLTNGKNFNLPIKIVGKKETIYGNLKTYNKEENLMLSSEFNSNASIMPDDKVYTSGLDGETVGDITIGKVVKEVRSDDKLGRKIFISLSGNFNNLDYLYVLGRDK
ncbi:rod shape-determining protein MreC [Streptococcus hongkongensis]